MPARSKSQQRLFGMVHAVRKGELDRDEVPDKVLDIADSDIKDKSVKAFAKTKHKSLRERVRESLLDIDDNDQACVYRWIEEEIRAWIDRVYDVSKYDIDIKNHTVSSSQLLGAIRVKDTSIDRLMPEGWSWGAIKSDFYCGFCKNLKTLEGAPEKAPGNFECNDCSSLKTLEGAPEVVGKGFYCHNCASLASLEGAPREVRGNFSCRWCQKLQSLEGSPKKVGGNFECNACSSLKTLEGSPRRVGGYFDCTQCDSLISFKGSPEEVGGNFYCEECKKIKNLDSLSSKIGGKIFEHLR